MFFELDCLHGGAIDGPVQNPTDMAEPKKAMVVAVVAAGGAGGAGHDRAVSGSTVAHDFGPVTVTV